VALFIEISIVYGIGQYLILGMVKSKNREKEIRRAHFNILERIVSIVQYVLTAVLILVVMQIILNSGYSTVMLRVAVMISYGFTIYAMSALSYSLFSWFRVNKILVVLLYGSGVAVIIVYVITVALIFDIALQENPALITPQSEIIFTSPTTIERSLNTLQTFCSIAYFLLIWGGNILLLHQNVHRIGKVKFWVLMSTPLIAWSAFLLFFYQPLAGGPIGDDPTMSIVVPVLLLTFSNTAALVLLGATFSSIAKAHRYTPTIRDYMIITGYVFILFFTATIATISAAGYPPFGLVNILLLGPFSFLILNGLFRSAICVAEDTELRHSIKALAKRESKLLDAAATAENLQEYENKVITAVRASARLLEEESGIEPSLTDAEIREQLEIVTQELRKYR
jgi:hypothetical protein